jgi:hypothetical protein
LPRSFYWVGFLEVEADHWFFTFDLYSNGYLYAPIVVALVALWCIGVLAGSPSNYVTNCIFTSWALALIKLVFTFHLGNTFFTTFLSLIAMMAMAIASILGFICVYVPGFIFRCEEVKNKS